MFKFNFSGDTENEENGKASEEKSKLNWLEAKRISLPDKYFKKNCPLIEYNTNFELTDYPLKIVDSEKVVIKLTEENCENIIEAESKHSDLIPAKYEGGLKVWECTYDLGNYVLSENIIFKNKTVLDLGCGAGILGLIAFLRGSNVHFQDYNTEVIESYTIPNIVINCDEQEEIKEKCQFFSGDWGSFADLISSEYESNKYDYIFTSETIYNPDNQYKLYKIFKQNLKKNGIGYIAGKAYYFGVGGGMRQFEGLIKKDGEFDVSTVWKSEEGLHREILKLQRKSIP